MVPPAPLLPRISSTHRRHRCLSTENGRVRVYYYYYYYYAILRVQGIGFSNKNYSKCVLHLETVRWKRRTSTIYTISYEPVSRMRVDVSDFVSPQITGTCIRIHKYIVTTILYNVILNVYLPR